MTTSESATSSRCRVLIVEDHDYMRLCYERYLDATDDLTATWVCETLQEAIDRIDEEVPDFIVTDLSLPETTGTETVDVLREAAPDVPLLVVSGHTSDDYVTSALDAGARGYVVKGNAREIVDAIRAVRDGTTYVSASARQE
jgi:DNA-binding NarL/FixJ family response regulator